MAGTKINEVNGRGLRKARHEISMIFQHFNLLWSRTVRDNIMFPLEIAGVKKSERIKRANELIKLVGLEGKKILPVSAERRAKATCRNRQSACKQSEGSPL